MKTHKPIISQAKATEKWLMSYHEMDHIFPFVVWFYGALLVWVLNSATLLKRGEEWLPAPVLERLNAHHGLAWLCFWVGGLWSLQEIWFA